MKKKLMALLLGAAMIASLLTGCGAKEETPAAAPAASEEAAEEEAPTEEAPAAEEEAPAEEAAAWDTSEHVDLVMYLVGDTPEGIDDVYAEINKILEEKLNCSITVEWLSWAEHDTNYSLLFSGGEDFDMIYTASGWCHFEQTVALGGFKALEEEYIQTYAPGVWEMMPQVAWDQATIDGSIYMVPANFIEVTPETAAIRGDLMEKYGYDDIASWDELVAFMKDCANDGVYGCMFPSDLNYLWFQSLGYSGVGGAPKSGETVFYNVADPTNTKLEYFLEWDAFIDYCHTMKELADAGCWPADVLSMTQEKQDGLVNGTAAVMNWNVGSCRNFANQANAAHPEWKINVYNIQPDQKYGATKYTNGGIGINAASENADRVMMVLNEFATNQDIQDLAQIGIKGVHWEEAGEGQYKVIEGNAYSGSNYWGWRNINIMKKQFQENPTEVDLKTTELEEYYLNNVRDTHVMEGFSFDSTSVSTQVAAVEAAMGTYYEPLLAGMVDDVDATIEEFRAALEAAGMNVIMEEMQKQLDAFLADK